MPLIEAQLKAVLVCPACRGELIEEEAQLRCLSCKRTYPVREFPIMLLEENEAPADGATTDAA